MTRVGLTRSLILLAVFILLIGCGKKTPAPVAIKEKTDKCALCNMAVKNNQFATELMLENGRTLTFDDLGCMEKWMKQNKDKKQAISYVRDYHSAKWVQLEKAIYVHANQAVKTPMAYNVISFATKQDAEKFINENSGKLLSYEDLHKYSWKRDPAQLKKLMEMKMKKEAGNTGKSQMDMK